MTPPAPATQQPERAGTSVDRNGTCRATHPARISSHAVVALLVAVVAGCIDDRSASMLGGSVESAEADSGAGDAATTGETQSDTDGELTPADARTGAISLLRRQWLSTAVVPVTYTRVSRDGDPVITVHESRQPEAAETFRVPFAEAAREASGIHTFGPLPGGSYVLRLVFDGDNVLDELTFDVLQDSDADGVTDGEDACPLDPDKVSEGLCGCGAADVDTDGDDVPDCIDECDDDSAKDAAGSCGCGVQDADADGDGVPDCMDACPQDVNKQTAGTCGCGMQDTDSDGDGLADCQDLCPDDPGKTGPGTCGCGEAEDTCVGNCPSELTPGVVLGSGEGEERCSPGGEFTFGLTDEGALTLRSGDDTLWVADASGPAASFRMQNDGNVVARAEDGSAVWSSKTQGNSGAVLTVEDDGSVLVRFNGSVLWSVGPFKSGDLSCRMAEEGESAFLSCPGGQAIASVEFASFGTPFGICGSAVSSGCHEDESRAIVQALCLGRDACEVSASVDTFGSPCDGAKRLSLSYLCGADDCPEDPNKSDPGVCGCLVADDDSDGDGTPDCVDGCPEHANKTAPGACGCGVEETDADGDGDGTPDCQDQCPQDATKVEPGVCGCGVEEAGDDADGDGAPDCQDECPGDPDKTAAGVCGCGISEQDGDADGTPDCQDLCPADAEKVAPGVCGCGSDETDSDSDGTPDCQDQCPTDPIKVAPGICGCNLSDGDGDGDGAADCQDPCPADPDKVAQGVCGCGVADTDVDGDGTLDCQDECPADPDKVAAGVCGCGVLEASGDADGDGTPDCQDDCPTDANKTEAGLCGCGAPETDTDGDGTADCADGCPDDANKADAGVCGCGVPDVDSDGDGAADCQDECDADPDKIEAGVCGCGVVDVDSDADGTLDCEDLCPSDADKTEPGECGCGVAEGECGPPCSNELLPRVRLGVGEQRCSDNGQYQFGIAEDGALTLREASTVLWTAPASGPADNFRLQGDGNIVARSEAGAAVWSSRTQGNSGAILTVEDNGSVLLRVGDTEVWSIGPFPED